MFLATILIGFGLLLIFAPRVAYWLLRVACFFLPEIIGSMVFLHIFLWLHRRSPIAATSVHYNFLVICTAILGAVVGRKVFLIYILPFIPTGLFRRNDRGDNQRPE